MIGIYITVIVLSTVFTVGQTAPRRSRGATRTEMWKHPCGTKDTTSNEFDQSGELLGPEEALDKLKNQFKLLIADFRHNQFKVKYEMDLDQHHYEPNEVPDENNVAKIKELENASSDVVVQNLPMLYTHLQTFAVAFEELVEDAIESKDPHQKSLIYTESKLIQTMCELDDILNRVPKLEVPKPIESFTLRPDPTIPDHETYRVPRVWGVILKYNDYLDAWALVLKIKP